MTFRYTDGGKQEGLSRCADLIFITTGGGPIQGKNFGYDYLKALSSMLGIRRTHCVTAENQDVQGNDVNAILDRAKEAIDKQTSRSAEILFCGAGCFCFYFSSWG